MRDLVLVSDLHVGSTVALWPPGLPILDDQVMELSAAQAWLWERWLDFCAFVPAGSRCVVVGDAMQGARGERDSGVMSGRWVDQERAAARVLMPLVEKCDETDFVYGTEWHEYESGQALLHLLSEMRKERPGLMLDDPQQELWLEWGEHLVHLAHHRGVATSPVSKATPLLRSLVDMLATAPQRDGLCPDIVVRAHAHEWGHLTMANGTSIALPSWQLKTRYIWKKDVAAVPTIGGVVLHAEGGDVWVKERIYRLAPPVPRRV